MKAQIRYALSWLSDMVWIVPATLVFGGRVLGLPPVAVDHSGVGSEAAIASSWLDGGGATGARALLGADVASIIGVASTSASLSITMAALSLATGQTGTIGNPTDLDDARKCRCAFVELLDKAARVARIGVTA